MQFKTAAEIEAVLAPKIKGTRVLEHVFKDLDLDFFAACSSVASFFGEFAQVADCSANAFLDAFCSNNSFKPSTFTVSMGWDAWKDSVGNTDSSANLQHSKDSTTLTAGEAVEVFDRILNLDASRLHVLVSTLGSGAFVPSDELNAASARRHRPGCCPRTIFKARIE